MSEFYVKEQSDKILTIFLRHANNEAAKRERETKNENKYMTDISIIVAAKIIKNKNNRF